MTEALFARDGAEHVVPTDLARGPWFEGALHGGPVAGRTMRAATRRRVKIPGPEGRVRAESALWDERGRIGRSIQSLLERSWQASKPTSPKGAQRAAGERSL